MFPIIPANSAAAVSGNKQGIFGFGADNSGNCAITNIVSNTGVVADDQAATTGTARHGISATQYGEDTAIFGFGVGGGYTGITNLVSNSGVVAIDAAAVGTARTKPGACSFGEYGGDKQGIFFGGSIGSAPWMYLSMTNIVSNAGVVGLDVTGVGLARISAIGCEYGEDTGIIGFGYPYGGPATGVTNLVSNTGVVASDTAGVVGATGRSQAAGCSYGGDKGIIGFGHDGVGACDITNLISNVGVVATDLTGVGTARRSLAACEYGGDKGIFGFGFDAASSNVSMTNKVSNGGVVASDTTGVGTDRSEFSACSFN
jgi:hypothetical protein